MSKEMQPSNQLKGLVESYGKVGTTDYHENKKIERTLVNAIGVQMVSEGYTEDDVLEFVSESSEGKILAKFKEALQNESVVAYITEDGTFDTKLRYVEGAIHARLHEQGGNRRHRRGRVKGGITPAQIGSGLQKAFGGAARAIGDFINPPRSKSADPVVRAGGSYTAFGGGPVLPKPKETEPKITAGPGSKNPQANYGTGRDGGFGTGTSGSGMPSNPPLRGGGSSGSSSSSSSSGSRGSSGSSSSSGSRGSSGSSSSSGTRGSSGSSSSSGTRGSSSSSGGRSGSSTATTRSKDPINVEYDRLRKKNPTTGRVEGSSKDLRAAEKFGKANSMSNKPKTPNPLMRGLRRTPERTAELAKLRADAKAKSMAQSAENKNRTRGPQRRGARFEENEFELVVQHLVSEGIAASSEGALIMLEGMSEEFITNILEQMQMGAAIVEFLIQNGEAESLEEANYIISEMDEENIDLLVQSVIEVQNENI